MKRLRKDQFCPSSLVALSSTTKGCSKSLYEWCSFEWRSLLQLVETGKLLDKFQNSLNKVQATSDFMYYVSTEILSLADKLRLKGGQEDLEEQ